jgi:hypothetical protein
MPTLCIQLHAGPGTSLHGDSESLNAQPWWEINVVSKSLDASTLKRGDQFFVPRGYDSRPPTTLYVEAWLTHDENTRRSMS